MLVYVKVGESKRFSMEVSEERQQGDWTLSPRGATARGLNAIGTDLIVYRDLCIVCIWEDPTFEIGSSCFELWLRYAMLVFLVLTCLHWLSFNSLLLVSSDLHRVTCVDRYTSARGYTCTRVSRNELLCMCDCIILWILPLFGIFQHACAPVPSEPVGLLQWRPTLIVTSVCVCRIVGLVVVCGASLEGGLVYETKFSVRVASFGDFHGGNHVSILQCCMVSAQGCGQIWPCTAIVIRLLQVYMWYWNSFGLLSSILVYTLRVASYVNMQPCMFWCIVSDIYRGTHLQYICPSRILYILSCKL